jgi:ribose transport system ATP-binding protein
MLILSDIEKSFGATRAVKSVSFDAKPGTVVGLVGENGAGKSTLIKILSGAVRPDRGEVSLNGRLLSLDNPHDALKHGIASVFQELTLVRNLSVEQNLLLTSAPKLPWRTLNWRAGRRTAQAILHDYHIDVRPGEIVRDLPLGRQQMLEIARAAYRKPAVLLLDEPTSALGAHEVEWLVRLVDQLRLHGAIVLFISHRWDEIIRFCDRVAIMRNGELVSMADTRDVSEDEAIRLMTGQNAEMLHRSKPPHGEEIVLKLSSLVSDALHDVNAEIRRGEILGLGGLVGQGQIPLMEAVFGLHSLEGGEIEVNGRKLTRPTPRGAIKAGVAYVPQERKTEGLLLNKSVGFNMTLTVLRRFSGIFGLIRAGLERRMVNEAIAALRIRTPSGAEPIRNLSGGNQQKALLQKWLFINPDILVLNDVTRGVDIGTKMQIYDLIADLSRRGVAVLWYSTDASELVAQAHRVIVMLGGSINAELTGAQITANGIVRASILRGVGDAKSAA